MHLIRMGAADNGVPAVRGLAGCRKTEEKPIGNDASIVKAERPFRRNGDIRSTDLSILP
jgi:hypothetical protein